MWYHVIEWKIKVFLLRKTFLLLKIVINIVKKLSSFIRRSFRMTPHFVLVFLFLSIFHPVYIFLKYITVSELIQTFHKQWKFCFFGCFFTAFFITGTISFYFLHTIWYCKLRTQTISLTNKNYFFFLAIYLLSFL